MKTGADLTGRLPNERNDCTVVALMNCTGLDYATCHLLAKQAGRRARCRFSMERLIRECGQRGVVFTEVLGHKDKTVAWAALTMPTGTYYVRINGHALVIKDHTIVDTWDSSKHLVRQVWKVDASQWMSFLNDEE